MGGICDCLRNICCCLKYMKEKSKSPKTDENKSESQRDGFKIEIEDKEVEEKRIISEAKLRKQALNAFKGGDSSYASLRGIRKLKEEDRQELELLKKFTQRYRLDVLDKCGSGNYAVVFKVFHWKMRRLFAFKMIDTTKIEDNYRLNLMPSELQVMKQKIKHPNIVRIYQITPQENTIFILMEYAYNGTMADWLTKQGVLTEDLAQIVFMQILNGVHALHSRSIAHRDLKLENILISGKFVPKISDFSYAIEVNPNNPWSTQYCGTIAYFAPELLQRIPYNPLISDIWSIGVCFYILLNDKLPFPLKDDDLIMLENQLNRKWSFRTNIEPKLSSELKNIISCLLEPNTELRATTRELRLNPWFTKYDKTKTII